MRDGWETRPLREVIRLEYGKPLPKEDRDDEGEFPAYGANGVKCRTNTFFYDKPSIIVGRKGSAGEVTLTENKFWPLDVTYFVTFDESRHDLIFLYHCLKSLQLTKLAKGVKPGINRNDVYQIEFSFPPLTEQMRIVAILDEAFDGIGRAVANAEKNLANARELFESYLDAVFTQRGEGWVTEELNKNVRFIDYRGKTPPKVDDGIRLITAKNVRMGFVQRTPEEFIDPAVYDAWMTRGFPRRGDVLFTTEAPLGNVAQLDTDETVVIGQRIITMQPDDVVLDRAFLKYALMSRPIQGEIQGRGTGATVLGIKARLLKQVPIFFPKDVSEQKKIAREIDGISESAQALESNYQKKLNDLAELKQSILQKAFAGELTAQPDQALKEAVA